VCCGGAVRLIRHAISSFKSSQLELALQNLPRACPEPLFCGGINTMSLKKERAWDIGI